MEPGGVIATAPGIALSRIDAEGTAAELEGASAEEALRFALEAFHPHLYIACSFQRTSSVIVDMATSINPEARFFYLDTDLLFEESYETRDRLEERYGIRFHRYSSIMLEQQARLYGEGPRSGRWAGTGKTECGLHG
jgi:3'-phosphoadenosine 5'-phosphosulfate sulfotransferase (PAPS reductase)/FAD synthetase